MDPKSIHDLDHHFLHPNSNLHALKQASCTIMHGSDGVYVSDIDGNRMLDGIGGLWCVNVGYGRHEVINAIAAQLAKLPFYSTFRNITNAPAAELAARVTRLAPKNLNHVFFGSSGSAGNDTAIRIAHYYFERKGEPERKLVLSRDRAYHGSTFLAAGLTDGMFRNGWSSNQGIIRRLSAPYSYRRPDEMSEGEFLDLLIDEMKEKVEAIGPEKIACFIAEPIMGAGGVIVPPVGYHKRSYDLLKQYGILYISDEVITAFGRIGHFFASQDKFGIEPDIINCAKGISSGYFPLSATLISDEIYEKISEPEASFSVGFTYSGHPAACAAGLANLDIMEREKICETVRESGPNFEETLRSLLDLDIVGDVRGSCFMMCIECVIDKHTKREFEKSTAVADRIAVHAQRRGLLVRPAGNLTIMSPPLIMNEEQISRFGEILRESIQATMDDLTKEGILTIRA